MTKKIILCAVLAASWSLLCTSLSAQVYMWVDEKGVVHFGDSAPSDGRAPENIQVVPVPERKPQFIPDPRSPSEATPWPEPYEPMTYEKDRTRSSGQEFKVELDSTAWCFFCKKARAFLNERKITFSEYDVEKDEAAARRKKTLTRGGGVPVAVIGVQVIVGFSEAAYATALEKAAGSRKR